MLLCKTGARYQNSWCLCHPACLMQLTQAKSLAAAPTQARLTKQLIALAASGAVLGPLCDGQHSRYGVLHYTSPSIIAVPGTDWHLETCWYCLACASHNAWRSVFHISLPCNNLAFTKTDRWVPGLFAVAAVIIGTGHTVLDIVLKDGQVGAANHAKLLDDRQD